MNRKRITTLAMLTLLVSFISVNGYAQQIWKNPAKYHKNGKVSVVIIKEGKKQKRAITTGYEFYYETGELRKEIKTQSDGLFICKEYYKNGQLGLIGTTKSSLVVQKVGLWKAYHKNGQLKKQVSFDNLSGEDGEVKEYFDNGILKMVGQYGPPQGKRIGVWKFYDKDGNLEKTEDYGEGRYITVIRRGSDLESEDFDL